MITSTEHAHKQRQYWSAYIKEEYPISRLPIDPIASDELGQQSRIQYSLDAQTNSKLQQYCKDSDFLWYCFVQAALQITLYKYDGEAQVMTASPLPENNKSNDLILPIKYTVDPENSFKAHVIKLREQLVALYAEESLLIKLAQTERFWPDSSAESQSGIMVTMKGMHQTPKDHQMADPHLASFIQIHFQRDQSSLHMTYSYPSTFEEQKIRQFNASYQELLKQAVANMEIAIRDLSICSPEQQEQILNTFNSARMHKQTDGSMIGYFENHVAAYPHHTAIAYQGHTLTYSELNYKANLLAHTLLNKHQVQPGQLVAVKMPKGIEYIVSILAILKAGGAYVPIDMEYPAERVQYIIHDSQVAVLLVKDERDGHYPAKVAVIEITDILKHEQSVENVHVASEPNALAYALYTSGTTGVPKGVLIEQQGVLNLIRNAEYLEMNHETVMLQTAAIIFDMSTIEIWGTLLNGGTLVIVDKTDLLAPQQLQAIMNTYHVNTLIITTALFHHLAGHHAGIFSTIKQLLTGGEILSPVMSKRILEMYPQLRLVNAYGPTECTVIATAYDIKVNDEQRIPIGKPLKGTHVLVLNAEGQLQPIGAKGELCIGGAGVGRSYLNRPDLTKDRFVPDFYDPSQLMYKTGDLACWNDEGEILFMGRADRQIKLRGYRIEPGEIENALLQHQAVREAVVIPITDKQMEMSLCAFIVCSDHQEASSTVLSQHLTSTIPTYMIPSTYIQVDHIPLKSSGKIDTVRLQEISLEQMQHQHEIVTDMPHTEEERKMCAMWASVLELPHIGIHQNFFESGGHSLKLVMLAEQLQDAGYKLNAMDIYKYPTVASFLQFQHQ